jgi:hypothetical protein
MMTLSVASRKKRSNFWQQCNSVLFLLNPSSVRRQILQYFISYNLEFVFFSATLCRIDKRRGHAIVDKTM